MKKLIIMTANFIFFMYRYWYLYCEYIKQQYLVLEVSVKSGIGAALKHRL